MIDFHLQDFADYGDEGVEVAQNIVANAPYVIVDRTQIVIIHQIRGF